MEVKVGVGGMFFEVDVVVVGGFCRVIFGDFFRFGYVVILVSVVEVFGVV